MIYLTVLFLLCTTLCLTVCLVVLNNMVGVFRDEAQRAFSNVEQELSNNIDSIDSYIFKIYADKDLVQDFEYFLHSQSEEEYLNTRLENSHNRLEMSSIVDDIRLFVSQSQPNLFTQISVHTDEYANLLRFSDYHEIEYNVSNRDPRFVPDITRGITYTRELVSKDYSNTRIGEMQVVLSIDWIENSIRGYNLPNMAVAGSQEDEQVFYEVVNTGGYTEDTYHQLLSSGRNKLRTSLFGSSIYCEIYTSGEHGYKLIALENSFSLFVKNSGIFAFVILCSAGVFIGMLFLIVGNMRQDAAFLSQIIQTINGAKAGVFTAADIQEGRNNEYRIISSELNDMCLKLDRHIRMEYVLKLKQKESEMIALQNQINPHFLYNTLEIIRADATMHQDQTVADAISNLGQLYRELVKSDPIIPIGKELDLLNSYLQLMEFRCSGDFLFQFDVHDSIRHLKTVKFWMQPIAENYFKHGYDSDSKYNLFVVTGRALSDCYVLEFIDNGRQLDEDKIENINHSFENAEEEEPGRSIGLRNVHTRLRYFYGNYVSMKLSNNDASGVSVVVTINKGVEHDVELTDRG